MTTVEPTERTDVQHQAPAPSPQPAEDRRHMIRRRALTLLTIVLLIGIPAGYLVISANQSRDSGKQKEARYAATGLTAGAPSKVQRRLYNVPLPLEREAVSYYETNNWKTSRLYVQFLTTQHGLNEFLTTMGSSVGALQKDRLPISARDRKVAGWDFTGTGDWRGLAHLARDPHPSQRVVVNLANPRYPQVYVVSSTRP
jgi:hypothetical protein